MALFLSSYTGSQIEAAISAALAGYTPAGTYATAAALTAAIPAGNTSVYLVTADSRWYYWNGTAWTAGGIFGGGMRRARQVVLTEAVSAISFSVDDDGNALNSAQGGELRIRIPENSGISTIEYAYLQLNGLTSGNLYFFGTTVSAATFRLGYAGGLRSAFNVKVDIVDGYVNLYSIYNGQYGSSGASGSINGGILATQTAITAINLYFSGYTFPIGTVAEWWERG